jgi:hypothetical protein
MADLRAPKNEWPLSGLERQYPDEKDARERENCEQVIYSILL